MADYTLSVSDEEIQRYRLMAEWARADEAAFWRQAGIAPGAVVADIGCGPAAMSVLLAAEVAPNGRVLAIEPAEAARQAATRVIAEAGVPNVDVRWHRNRSRAAGRVGGRGGDPACAGAQPI
jgi:tRNA A58 N-methylase Trm61